MYRSRQLLFALAALVAPLAAEATNLTIPATYPRIWYGNAARLQQARTYFQTTPFTPSGSDASELAASRALHSLMTQNPAECTTGNPSPVAHLVAWNANTQAGGFRDAMRQQGDSLLAVYDWCHGSLTPSQITTLVARWNGYMDTENADSFANRGSGANNYFWGRERNQLWWGITTFGENARAQEFINHALDIRYAQWFTEWYTDFGRGGLFAEGPDYGSVQLSYPILAFQSAADYGFDPYSANPFFREAIYSLIYNSTPSATTISGGFSGGSMLFPFNDQDGFQDGSVINTRKYLGDFARFMGQRGPTTGNARAARAWLQYTNAGRSWMFDALGGTGSASDIQSLPLDYYAPGAENLWMRTGHDANSTAAHVQINTPGGVEHRHLDAGNWQIWRKGRWIVRESAGYSDLITGFGGNPPPVDTDKSVPHNGLLFQGRTTGRWVGSGPIVIPPGQPRGDNPLGLPEVTRLLHHPDVAFLAADFSKAYRNTFRTRVDWPYADKAVREFLFIRALNALVIFDRTRGSSDSQDAYYSSGSWIAGTETPAPYPHVPGASVVRTFVSHFETTPAVSGNRIAATVGNQVAEQISLVPGSPTFRVVNEDQPGDEAAGQFRVELDQSGQLEMYFLNVVYGRDVGQPQMTASVIDNGPSYTINLAQGGATATATFVKGMASTGGTFSVNGAPTTSFPTGVQGIVVTADGPVWDAIDILLRDGFE